MTHRAVRGAGGLAPSVAVRNDWDSSPKTRPSSKARASAAFWGGYSGYFADPDGHPWEIAYNPFWKLDDAGRVVLPE